MYDVIYFPQEFLVSSCKVRNNFLIESWFCCYISCQISFLIFFRTVLCFLRSGINLLTFDKIITWKWSNKLEDGKFICVTLIWNKYRKESKHVFLYMIVHNHACIECCECRRWGDFRSQAYCCPLFPRFSGTVAKLMNRHVLMFLIFIVW